MIRLSNKSLLLTGISLRGSFEMINNNENLAVLFQITIDNNEIGFEIEPEQGVILPHESKTVKVRVKEKDREKAVSSGMVNKLKINTTMKTEYNHKMFKKLQLNGWEKISNSYQTTDLPVYISEEAKSIREQIREQIAHSSRHSSEFLNTPLSPISHRFNEKMSKNYSEKRPTSQKQPSKKLNPYLFKSQQEMSANSNILPRKPANTIKSEYPPNMVPSRPENVSYGKPNNVPEGVQTSITANQMFPRTSGSFHTRYNSRDVGPVRSEKAENSQRFVGPVRSEKSENSQRFVEIVLLAALAGFFLALGSNFRRHFI